MAPNNYGRWWANLPALVLCTAVLAGAGPAGNRANATTERRYLLIVETSKAMQRRAAGLDQTVRQMLGNSLRGDLHAGDTLGLWTFNEQLYTGQFRLRRYSADEEPALTTELATFLKKQKYRGAPQWNSVVPALNHVVKSSPELTIIVVTAGTEAIQGTPFDARINAALSSWQQQQQTARMPLITVLRARGGKLIDFAVSAVPWPMQLPPWPAEPVAATGKTPALTNAPAKAASAAPAPAALIFSGKKHPATAPAGTSAPATSPTNSALATTASAASVPQAMVAAPSSNNPLTVTPVTETPSIPPQALVDSPKPGVEATPKAAPAPANSTAAATPTTEEPPRAAQSIAEPKPTSAEATASTAAAGPGPERPREQVASAGSLLPSSRRLVLWLGGFGGALAGVLAAYLFWKRSRTTGQVSLITRAIEQQTPQARTPESDQTAAELAVGDDVRSF